MHLWFAGYVEYTMKILSFLSFLLVIPVFVNAETSKISKLDFENIITLKQELSEGIYENYIANKYGEFVSYVSLKLLEEEQLHVIGNGISKGIKLYKLSGKKKTFVYKALNAAYIELDMESKHQLIPLFLNKKSSQTSYYFDDPEIQNLTFQIYLALLKNDSITLERVEKDFFDINPTFITYPYLTGALKVYMNSK